MFSKKVVTALALAALSGLFISSAFAQWIPGSTVVNLGDFRLTGSAGQSGGGVYQIGRAPVDSHTTASLPNNNSTMNNTQLINTPANTQPAVLDLTGYARDRLKGNLSGYSNIMYPLGESRGTTATTSSTSGCGCG